MSVFLIRPLLSLPIIFLFRCHSSFLSAFLTTACGVKRSNEDVSDEPSDFCMISEVLSVAFWLTRDWTSCVFCSK